jgi:tRNA G18 (ribose-2'-O)-methylase SpoU
VIGKLNFTAINLKAKGHQAIAHTMNASGTDQADLWDLSRMAEPSLLKYNVHTPLQGLSVQKVQQLSEKTALPLCLMLFNLNGDMNVGMSIRSAVIFGCSDVFIVGKRKYDRRPEVGAKHYIKIHRSPSIAASFFVENKLVPIFVEQGGVPLEEFSFKPYLPSKLLEGWKVCLVLGSESFGLPMEVFKDLKAPVLSISQYGVLRSLNVSVATGIVLYEFARQWRASICV